MKDNTRSNSVVLTLTREQATFALETFLSITTSYCKAAPRDGADAVRRAWRRDGAQYLKMVKDLGAVLSPEDEAGRADADKGLELGELVEDAMKDKLVTVPVKMTKAQHARLLAAAEIVGAPVEDIVTAHVMAGLDWDSDVLEDALEAISESITRYAKERRTFARRGNRHPLQVVPGERPPPGHVWLTTLARAKVPVRKAAVGKAIALLESTRGPSA